VALGAYEVSLLELTGAFSVFQNAGERRPPYLISQIATSRGDVIYVRPQKKAEQVYQRELAGSMVGMMKGVVQRGTGIRAAIDRPSAGKTGTSQNWRDAWFIGFTPDWIAGVWVGNDNDRPMNRVTGGDLPAQIWRRFMTVAHQGLPVRDFDFVPGRWDGGEIFEEDPLAEELEVAEEETAPPPVEAVRDDFYSSLAEDFAKAPEQ
jgi:penicillin-binding protein 1A